MQLKFQCPHCPAAIVVEPLESADAAVVCPNCKNPAPLTIGPEVRLGAPLTACCLCGSTELFSRNDFPQRAGLALVAAAAVASVALYGYARVLASLAVLAGAVLADLGLFFVLPRLTGCYRCRAEYRRVPVNPAHGDYDLAVADKYRPGEIRKG